MAPLARLCSLLLQGYIVEMPFPSKRKKIGFFFLSVSERRSSSLPLHSTTFRKYRTFQKKTFTALLVVKLEKRRWRKQHKHIKKFVYSQDSDTDITLLSSCLDLIELVSC